MTKKLEALRLLEDALKELESQKGSVFSAVQKLSRAATLLGNDDIQIWCSIQFGDSRYVPALKRLLQIAQSKDDAKSEKRQIAVKEALSRLNELGLKPEIHFTHDELTQKAPESGGGYVSIGFVEENYADLIRAKRGNDGTYYKNNLYSHLDYVRKRAHGFASAMFNQLKFAGTVSNSFDVLRTAVDDKLLDLNPVLAEQLMLAFRGVSSSNDEEWSQALTTCRRLLEGLADQLYPVNKEPAKGRALGQTQYVNRLWAFMDNAIESESNRELAKTHVDFLGSWLEKTNKITNKGVHAEVQQLEAVKAVFHTYLVIADLLDYLGSGQASKAKPDINSATIDELEALLDISRATAKEIVKARVQHGKLDKILLSKVHGVGPKTVEKAVSAFAL
ncbi:ComEA family DNA-binding protein [Burkholderia pseudomallei]|uniref:ComEA family DNA-binding protein n=1 Tax=Burkholderia pseudomallei TaxID=28450 RepID=UPI000572228B|nr:helix-hairpin-helix domain-containing protein [Burkholderia pseudomallei]